MARSKKQWRKRRSSASNHELAVLPIAPLTEQEEQDKVRLERKVERAFFEAGL
ncbi:MAG: hypothetical protein AB4368_25095 [Xenococcaceae cyanobacterium]